jgi:hypothetical protein
MKATVLLVLCAGFLAAGYGVTACVGDDPSVSTTTQGEDAGEGGASGKELGAACVAGGDCASANCADGVCCDTACSGTCEKCNLPGTGGKCLPIADGDDPDKECPTAPLPPPVESDAGADASAEPFVSPDAGTTSDDNMCAGKCNGKRACAYAGKERTCGSVYCGNTTQQGRAACDAKGHCLFGVEDCSAYSCNDGSPGCKKTCTGDADCLTTHYCDGATNTCKQKLANGTKCTSVVECKSGNCEDAVCCNSVCDALGAKCDLAGKVGTCACNECLTGPCALFYRDEDGDGYGDVNGTVSPPGNGRAMYGCVGAPPAGFVDNKLDCYDGPPGLATNVHPLKAGDAINWGSIPYTPAGGTPSFDYDCSGNVVKETREYPANTIGCGFCNPKGGGLVGCNFASTCGTAGQHAGLDCQSNISVNACAVDSTSNFAGPPTTSGFRAVVDCGVTAVLTTCGACSAAGGTNAGNTANQIQRCR